MTDAGWQDEFRHLLSSFDEEDWGRAFALKDPQIPSRLYKYRSFDAAGNALNALRQDYVWMSPASQFNDVFDTSLTADMEPTLRDLVRAEIVNHAGSKMTDQERAELLDPGLTAHELIRRVSSLDPESDDPTAFAAAMLGLLARMAPATRLSATIQGLAKVCCFTTDPKSSLMWAHYASNNTGFCVEYQVTDLEVADDRRRFMFPVCYAERRFDISPWVVAQAKAVAMIPYLASAHKERQWEYEREWRMIALVEGHSSGFATKMPAASAVYLGCRIGLEDRKTLLGIAETKQIPVYEMTIHGTQYELEPRRLEIGGCVGDK